MKGVKKCGLLLVLFIMLGLSLGVCSDTSALKHNLSAMPLYLYYHVLPDGTVVNQPIVGFSLNTSSSLDFDISATTSPKSFRATRSSSSTSITDQCSWYTGSGFNLGSWVSSGNFRALSTDIVIYSDPVLNNPQSNCSLLGAFGTGDKPSFQWDSIPLVYRNSLSSLNPYNYEYLSYVYSDTWTSDQGVVYTSPGLSFSDLIGFDNVHLLSDTVIHMSIPIGVISDIARNSDDFVDISVGTSLDFNYELYITDVTSYDLTSWNNSSVILQYAGYGTQNSVSQNFSGSITCIKDTPIIDDWGGGNSGIRLSWTCPFVSSYDVYENAIGFNFSLSGSPLWDVTFDDSSSVSGDISFFNGSMYVVTDHDDTPGSSIGGNSTDGSDPGSAPGSAENWFDRGDAEADWFATLTNLFNFNFLNPFAPLFQMFSDNSQCGSIPIIAGMLHAESSTYCPWFDSTVRNILTPVLSISSIMLLFGFTVHWLGSSSGNMFEDSGTHQWGKYQFKQGGKK